MSKISELSSATTPLAGTEVVPIVQGGVTKKVAASAFGAPDLSTYAYTLATVAALTAATVPAVVNVIFLEGYRSRGVGGHYVRRVNAQPSHNWKYQSADGTWWEGFSYNNVVTVEQFGAYADMTNDDYTAIDAALTYAAAMNLEYPYYGSGTTGIIDILFPSANYKSSATIAIPSGLWGVRLRGRNSGFAGSPEFSRITFPVDVSGITVPILPHGGIVIEGLTLEGVNGNGTAYGIWTKSPIAIRDVRINQFSMDGIFFDGTGGANCDRSLLMNTDITHTGRHGIYASGADANIIFVANVSCRNIGGSGVWCQGNFGSSFNNVQIAGSGIQSYQTRTDRGKGAMCHDGSNRVYAVIVGQDTAASTTDPATDTSHTVWMRVPAFDAYYANYPAWTTAQTWKAAPSFYSDNNSSLINPYVEATYSPPGVWMGPVFGGTTIANPGFENGGGYTSEWTQTTHGLWLNQQGWGVSNNDGSEVHKLGYEGTFLATSKTGFGSLVWSWVAAGFNDLWTWDGSTSSTIAMALTGGSTASTFGRAGSVPYAAYFPNGVAFARADGTGRLVKQDTAAPTTGEHARGEIVLHSNATSSSLPFAWRCVDPGTPGTWEAVYPGRVPDLGVMAYGSLPAANSVANGTTAIITDCNSTTLGATAAGGGSNRVRVNSDTTNWKIG